MGRLLKRLLSLLAALIVMGGFYAFAVLVEGGDAAREGDFTVKEDPAPITAMEEYASDDARALARAFGASMPVPGSPVRGRVAQGKYHGYMTRVIRMQGAAGDVTGIRPASAAPAILPGEAVFLASQEALLGFPALVGHSGGRVVYALVTNDAAFLIVPNYPEAGLAGFAPEE